MKRTLRTVAIAAGLAASVVLVAPPAANAQVDGVPSLSVDGNVSSKLVPVFDEQRGAVRMMAAAQAEAVIERYWTPQRLAAAEPAQAPDAGQSASRSGADRSAKAIPRDVTDPVAPLGQGVSPLVAFTQTEGKVFFHDPSDGKDHSCSGGAINSAKRRLVLTAGHCVHGGKGKQWMTNWVFYPGYQRGAGSKGVFPSYQQWAKNAWTNDGDFGYDYGFVITQNNDRGEKIVDAVGGNGLTIDPGRPAVTAIGYPGNFENGEVQAYCQNTLSRRNILNRDQQLNCDMRFGASGSPWLRDYNDSNGLGYAVSNQSYSLNDDGSGPEYGPYYDDNTKSLYNAAENASP